MSHKYPNTYKKHPICYKCKSNSVDIIAIEYRTYFVCQEHFEEHIKNKLIDKA